MSETLQTVNPPNKSEAFSPIELVAHRLAIPARPRSLAPRTGIEPAWGGAMSALVRAGYKPVASSARVDDHLKKMGASCR